VGSIIILLAMFVLLWALLIRPQRAKQQRQQRMLSDVAPGDEILTVGGIYGIVVEVEEDDDDDVIVEIADGIHVRIARRAIASVEKADEDEDDDDAAEADDEVVEGEAEEVEGLVTVPDDAASIEETQRRLDESR
jgi:preprotein translocase subunit YajC